ncbi:hypothetical protein L345_14810, partial [Ophiophagus hannah]
MKGKGKGREREGKEEGKRERKGKGKEWKEGREKEKRKGNRNGKGREGKGKERRKGEGGREGRKKRGSAHTPKAGLEPTISWRFSGIFPPWSSSSFVQVIEIHPVNFYNRNPIIRLVKRPFLVYSFFYSSGDFPCCCPAADNGFPTQCWLATPRGRAFSVGAPTLYGTNCPWSFGWPLTSAPSFEEGGTRPKPGGKYVGFSFIFSVSASPEGSPAELIVRSNECRQEKKKTNLQEFGFPSMASCPALRGFGEELDCLLFFGAAPQILKKTAIMSPLVLLSIRLDNPNSCNFSSYILAFGPLYHLDGSALGPLLKQETLYPFRQVTV